MRMSPLYLGPAVALLLLAGCTAAPPAPTESAVTSSATPSESPSPEAGPAGPCQDTDLEAQLSPEDGTAGHLHYKLLLTNTGSADCVINGFADIFVVGLGTNSQMGLKATHAAGFTPIDVIIAPGKHAAAQLDVVDIEPDGGPFGETCGIGHGDGYQVLAPHSFVAIPLIAAGVPACTNGRIEWMEIGPMQAT
jgi:Protein of unknown function (DUF4232)